MSGLVQKRRATKGATNDDNSTNSNKFVVVIAGLPRSGSTLLFNIVRVVLTRAGIPFKAAFGFESAELEKHGKREKDANLVKEAPRAKKVLEIFIHKVKAMLKKNRCMTAMCKWTTFIIIVLPLMLCFRNVTLTSTSCRTKGPKR